MASDEPHSVRGQGLIFVGGAARSGTTMIQNCLDSHPQICGGPVFIHVRQICQLRKQILQSLEAGWIDAFCDRQRVDQVFAQAIESLLQPLRERSGCTWLSEKTTANVLAFVELAEFLPAAKFVWVVRDPRAVVSSLLEVGRRARAQRIDSPDFTRSLNAAVTHAKQRIHAGHQAHQQLPDRVFPAVYERWVDDPQAQTQALCSFLNIEWSQRMVHPADHAHPGEYTVANTIWYESKDAYYRNPSPTEISKWQHQLGAVQKAWINHVFAGSPATQAYDYDIHTSAWTPLLVGLGKSNELLSRLAKKIGRLSLRAVRPLREP